MFDRMFEGVVDGSDPLYLELSGPLANLQHGLVNHDLGRLFRFLAGHLSIQPPRGAWIISHDFMINP